MTGFPHVWLACLLFTHLNVRCFQDLGKAKGDRLLYDNVNFSLPRGGVVGIIGANGVGKVRKFYTQCGRVYYVYARIPEQEMKRAGHQSEHFKLVFNGKPWAATIDILTCVCFS